MTMRALKIASEFGKLTQQGTARKVRRQAKRTGLKDLNAGQRIHYAEHFLKNPIKSLMGRPEMKTMLVSNFRYSADPTLGGVKSRARMTEAVAVQGNVYKDNKVVASACIDPSGKYANGQVNSAGIGNKDYMARQSSSSFERNNTPRPVANSNEVTGSRVPKSPQNSDIAEPKMAA